MEIGFHKPSFAFNRELKTSLLDVTVTTNGVGRRGRGSFGDVRQRGQRIPRRERHSFARESGRDRFADHVFQCAVERISGEISASCERDLYFVFHDVANSLRLALCYSMQPLPLRLKLR